MTCLVRFGADWARALQALLAKPPVHRYLFDGIPPDPGFADGWVARTAAMRAHASACGAWVLVVEGALGGVGWLDPDPDVTEAELGYALAPTLWGRGLATRLAWTLVERAFADARIGRVWADADLANAASVAVLRRIGMSHVGDATFALGPGVIYARGRNDPAPVPVPDPLAYCD